MKKIRPKRHPFRFKLENGKIITAWAKVRPAKRPVTIVLRPEHVRKSLAMDGQGNTQHCAMSVCSRDHGDAFPHPFEFVDWLYNRAYFADKTKDGLPTGCVSYQHNDGIAPLFDNTAAMKKFLTKLEKRGSYTITLYPAKYRKREGGRPRGRNTGERKRPYQPRGAGLRVARLRGGAAPAAA